MKNSSRISQRRLRIRILVIGGVLVLLLGATYWGYKQFKQLSPSQVDLDIENPASKEILPLRTFNDSEFVNSLAFSADGKIVASGTGARDGNIKLWDAKNGALLNVLQINDNIGIGNYNLAVFDVAFSADNHFLISSNGGTPTVTLWRMQDHIPIKTFAGYGGDFSPDSHIIAVINTDHTINLWRIDDGSLVQTFRGAQEDLLDLSFNPDGSIIAACSADGAILLWHMDDQNPFRILDERGSVDRNVSKNGTIKFSPDGRLLASSIRSGDAKLWNVKDGKLLQTLAGQDPINSLAFSPGGQILAAGTSGQVHVDSGYIPIGLVRIWQVNTGKLLQVLDGQEGYVTSVVFSPDGKILASGGQDKKIKFWEVQHFTP